MKKKKKNFTIEKATGLTTQEIKALINQHEQTVKLIDLINELNVAMISMAKRIDKEKSYCKGYNYRRGN